MCIYLFFNKSTINTLYFEIEKKGIKDIRSRNRQKFGKDTHYAVKPYDIECQTLETYRQKSVFIKRGISTET